ncbi:unnamed protein product [Bursaphelenchus okinawaensis]|uniref:Uncharacterized protein n=1 Tax=Bursaphelenchus okinawaensis TaxID=465554 RepID=A0A811KU20_9BILA|nr:unnamed protein product [Bursaphelenchus okinawaensis]CAG9112184.1 unnamed protein product [Bursaphelenchus okinawaensis]
MKFVLLLLCAVCCLCLYVQAQSCPANCPAASNLKKTCLCNLKYCPSFCRFVGGGKWCDCGQTRLKTTVTCAKNCRAKDFGVGWSNNTDCACVLARNGKDLPFKKLDFVALNFN